MSDISLIQQASQPSAHSVERRVATARLAHLERLQSANAAWAARYPGCSVRPIHILGETVWNGRHGSLLLNILELTPYDVWNVGHLAADDASAHVMGLPMAPLGELPDVIRHAEQQISNLAREHGVVVKGFMGRVAYGNGASRQAMRDAVALLARSLYDDIIVPTLSAQHAGRHQPLAA